MNKIIVEHTPSESRLEKLGVKLGHLGEGVSEFPWHYDEP